MDDREAAVQPDGDERPSPEVSGRGHKSTNLGLHIKLLLVSFASLYWELFLIRWIPSELPFVGYFRSLVLLAAFFGMGLGCLLYGRIRLSDDKLVNGFLAGICTIFLIVAFAGEQVRWRGFERTSGVLSQRFSGPVPDMTLEFVGRQSSGDLVVIGTFVLVSVLFLPVGLIIARLFESLPPIRAYALNISGALLGTLSFVPLCLAQTSPPVWTLVGLAAVLPLLASGRSPYRAWKPFIPAALFSTIAVAAIWIPNRKADVLWSPYQRVSWDSKYITLGEPDGGEKRVLFGSFVFVNHEYHQQIVNLGLFRDVEHLKEYYEITGLDPTLPDSLMGFMRRYYRPYAERTPESVLIIAAGTGNEAAAALRHGATRIVAVEIDPGIIELGRRYHPEAPYASPKVRVVCDDARAFLQRTDDKYDLIVMNAVDSHSQFATSAGLRLDSYIFTVEFFEQVRRHLETDGIFAMEFSGFHWNEIPWSRERINEMLWRVFGFRSTPQTTAWGAGGPQFLIPRGTPPTRDTYSEDVLISTDNWPQFYLRRPMIPAAYLRVFAVCIIFSLLAVLATRPKGIIRFDGHFFALGAAFMLLEIKSISELSLLFGATWLVNSLVIAAILVAVGAATLLVLWRGRIAYPVSYSLLFVSLTAAILLGPNAFLMLDLPLRILCAGAMLALPVFGAALVFASSFQQTSRPSAALAWNLFGAMLGGFGEYFSLLTGVSGLGLYIVLLYALSWLLLAKGPSRVGAGVSPTG